MALGAKQVLSLDWNRRELRMVLVRPRSDGVDLLKAVCLPIPAEVRVEEPPAFGAFIRESMKQARISIRKVILCVPRDQVVLNTLNVPPTPSEEIPAIVQFQVVKELPFSADQATLDFAVCGAYDPKAPSSVLVAAVRNEDLAYYGRVAEAAGLSIESIGLRPYSNIVAVMGNAPDLAQRNVLVVEVGPQLTEIDIIKKGVLAFSRSASVALAEFGGGDAEEYRDSRITGPNVANREPDEWSGQAISNMMVEIIRSHEAYRATDPGFSLDHIVVCGSSGLEVQLAHSLAARFATKADLYIPDKALGLSAQRARELRGFSAAIGLAMDHGRKGLAHFDFLHPKKPISKRQLRLRKLPVAAATIVLFLGSAVTFYSKFVSPQLEAVEKLRDEVALKKKDEKKIKDFKSRVETLDAWIESDHVWPEVLVALTEVFPDQKEAYVTRLDFETRNRGRGGGRESVARLKFRTVSLGAVNELANRLREAGFRNVVPGRETSSGTKDAYTKDTGIDMEVPEREVLMASREARFLEEEEDAAEPVSPESPPPVEPSNAKPVERGPKNESRPAGSDPANGAAPSEEKPASPAASGPKAPHPSNIGSAANARPGSGREAGAGGPPAAGPAKGPVRSAPGRPDGRKAVSAPKPGPGGGA